MSTKPNSYDNVSASSETLFSVVWNIRSVTDGLAFVQPFLPEHARTVGKTNKKVSVVHLHAFRLCLNSLLILHRVSEDGKAYQSSAVTLGCVGLGHIKDFQWTNLIAAPSYEM